MQRNGALRYLHACHALPSADADAVMQPELLVGVQLHFICLSLGFIGWKLVFEVIAVS
jgi:hypothetical protein